MSKFFAKTYEGLGQATLIRNPNSDNPASIVVAILITLIYNSDLDVITVSATQTSTSGSEPLFKLGDFKFTALGYKDFVENTVVSFSTSFPYENGNNLLIGTGSIDVRKLVKCKYISVELSAHSLNQGENAIALAFVAKKLKLKK